MRWIVYVSTWPLSWFAFNLATGMFLSRPLLSSGVIGFYAWKLLTFLPLIFLLARLACWAKDRRASIPQTFSGWPYWMATVGFWISAIAVGGTVFLAVLQQGLSGLSGIPAGMALIVAGGLVLPALLYAETMDIRARLREPTSRANLDARK